MNILCPVFWTLHPPPGDIVHARSFFSKHNAVTDCKKSKCCNTTNPSQKKKPGHAQAMEIQRPPRSGFREEFARQKRSAMDNFFQTRSLPVTFVTVEENTSVNMLSTKRGFNKMLLPSEKKRDIQFLLNKFTASNIS